MFERDETGAYTKIVRTFLCSSGRTDVDEADPEDEGTPTPRGIWKIGGRERFGKFANFGSSYARYWVQIVGSIYFHSILFNKRSIDAMDREAYSDMGSKVSHGCVRLYVEDARWLYYYACPGTTIEISAGEPSKPRPQARAQEQTILQCIQRISKDDYGRAGRTAKPACLGHGGGRAD